jgi:NADH-quinone oxidoreductase subunit D
MLRRAVRFGIRVNSGKVCLGIFFFATRQLKQAVLAFGPQHPAAHGILKLQLILSGEVIRWLDPQFGLLHRGTEKLFESRNLLQSLPYFDRFDYVANLFQEHAFCRAVESLHAYRTSLSAQVSLARGVFDELSRVLNHLLTLGATSLDLSAMGPIF